MKIQPIPSYLTSRLNDCNHYGERPWVLTSKNQLYLDPFWLNKQTEDFKRELFELLGNNVSDEPVDPTPDMTDIEWDIYHLYLNNFNYSRWHNDNLIQNVSIIDLDLKRIKEVSSNCCYNFGNFLFELPKLQEEYQNITEALKKYDSPVFVKLDQLSAKTDTEIRPLKNAEEILFHITHSKKLYKSVYGRNLPVKLILIPWKKIDPKYEFRIFICNKKVVAISQQNLYDQYHYTVDEITNIIHLIKNADLIHYLPYQEVVCDIFIENNNCHLIECNPYGAYSASGSSLFCWIKDKNLLLGKEDFIEFRFNAG
jgi:hypothetical protein